MKVKCTTRFDCTLTTSDSYEPEEFLDYDDEAEVAHEISMCLFERQLPHGAQINKVPYTSFSGLDEFLKEWRKLKNEHES